MQKEIPVSVSFYLYSSLYMASSLNACAALRTHWRLQSKIVFVRTLRGAYVKRLHPLSRDLIDPVMRPACFD
jgi:hypothetical protein